MVPQLILLLACLGATEGATVTLTEYGENSDVFPWPASGQFRVSVPCDNNMSSYMLPKFDINQQQGSIVRWDMPENKLRFLNSQTVQTQTLPPRDCNEGDGMIFKVQWIGLGGEVSVEYKGTVITGTVGGAQSDNTWFLGYRSGYGNVTATDDGNVKNRLTVHLKLFIY